MTMSEQPAQSKATSNPGADTPFFNRDDVLRCPNETLHDKIVVLAVQFAILGYSETASNLIFKLNKHDWHHAYPNRVRPLHLLWDLLGQWPEGELTRVHEEIQDDRQRRAEQRVIGLEGDETNKKVKLEVEKSPITDEDVKKYVKKMYSSYTTCWWYPARPQVWSYYKKEDLPLSPHDPKLKLSAEEVKKRIQSLLEAIEEQKKTPGKLRPGAESMVMSGEALVSALDLRIRLQEMDSTEFADVPSAEDILSRIAKDLGERGVLNELVQSQRAWTLLKDSILIKLLNINKTNLDLIASELESAITQRLETGRQHAPTPSIASLLSTINTNSLTHPDSIEYFQEMDRPIPTTILHNPASSSVIAETESRLGTTLPEDYKEYLRITNGNDAAFGGIIREAPLFKCEDIRWIDDDENYFSDLTLEIPHNSTRIANALSGDGLDWPEVGKGIVIGSEDIDYTLLITPETVKEVKDRVSSILEDDDVGEDIKQSLKGAVEDFAGSVQAFMEMEWCLVTWAMQMDGHSSFTAYLSHVAEHSKQVEKDCWNMGYGEFFGYMLVDKAGEPRFMPQI
jgi:hypothetical protein